MSQHHHDPMLIAAALKLPVKTVQNVLDRFSAADGLPQDVVAVQHGGTAGGTVHDESPVVVVYPKGRYAIMDVSGRLTSKTLAVLQEELKNAQPGLDYRAVAVRMADVKAIDEHALKTVADFVLSLGGKTKFTAILDPSAPADDLISKVGLEDRLPVFGTERAFEDAAFRTGTTIEHSKKKRLARGAR